MRRGGELLWLEMRAAGEGSGEGQQQKEQRQQRRSGAAGDRAAAAGGGSSVCALDGVVSTAGRPLSPLLVHLYWAGSWKTLQSRVAQASCMQGLRSGHHTSPCLPPSHWQQMLSGERAWAGRHSAQILYAITTQHQKLHVPAGYPAELRVSAYWRNRLC